MSAVRVSPYFLQRIFLLFKKTRVGRLCEAFPPCKLRNEMGAYTGGPATANSPGPTRYEHLFRKERAEMAGGWLGWMVLPPPPPRHSTLPLCTRLPAQLF